MRTALVGYTGFVGANLSASYQFTDLYNSKNIESAYGTAPDLLVYAGLPAAMFKANSNPEADFVDILQAIENIKAIKPKQIVLVSSVAVYDRTFDVDENHVIDERQLLPYGKNRLYLEKWVSESCENSLIVRLPALYGLNLKKNFIYDYINVIPGMLNEKKYQELVRESDLIASAYTLADDKFYHLSAVGNEKKRVFEFFRTNSFNAISFTDSRSIYQFYNLGRLWTDIQTALKNGLRLLNITTEPVSVAEVYKVLSGNVFVNELVKPPYNYDIKTIHAELFGGQDGYLIDKATELAELKQYVDEEKERIWG
ncbi:MAG: NAD(P)-dependent oxidoreductase [Oscillospiraceae bacterium]|nr:NAD(P)-dependent oxidoreductase [Oscillospiraceae bacterium]